MTLHAVLFVCAFPTINWWPLALLAPAPLAWAAIRARSTRWVMVVTLVVLWTMWMWLDRWLIDVTVAGYPLKSLYMTSYGCAFVWAIRRLSRHRTIGRWPMTLLVPLLWVGIECVRGEIVFGGYPWFLLGQPFIEWPVVAQSADLCGTYLLSFMAAAAAGAAVDVIRSWENKRPSKRAWWWAGGAAAVLGLNAGYGLWRLKEDALSGTQVRILVIQTNLPQSNKIAWSPEAMKRDVASFVQLTREAFAATGGEVDLVVWPETMLPVRGLEEETLRTLRDWWQVDQVAIAEQALLLQQELGVPMLLGAPCHLGLRVTDERAWDWETNYNSVYLIDGVRPYQRYDKCRLTPFGEVMPYLNRWPWLEEKLLGIGAPGMSFSLDEGERIKRLNLMVGGEELTLATPICFEDTLGRFCRKMVYQDGRKMVGVVVNLSNDGWFGRYDSGRAQHAQVARLRCIENRVPMVRCVNTGLSMGVDPHGRIVGTVGEGSYGTGCRQGWLLMDAVTDGRKTVYSCIGELWGWSSLVAGVLALGWTLIGGKEKG